MASLNKGQRATLAGPVITLLPSIAFIADLHRARRLGVSFQRSMGHFEAY